MTEIELIKCKEMSCFSHDTYNFFCNQEATRFIVRYHFKDNTNMQYGLLETHVDGRGNGVCVMNNQFLYNYGERCYINGYLPVKINE